MEARGLKTLEEFTPEWVGDFIDYWISHHPTARKSRGFKSKSRFEPHHNQEVQFSLHSFFFWAHATGRLRHNAFPLAPPVRGGYFFPETADYLRFCEEHKGLAENSLIQVELFVRRFDRFLHSGGLTSWNRIESNHIDMFVSRQASHNIGRIQRIHAVLRGLFRYLFSLGRLDRELGISAALTASIPVGSHASYPDCRSGLALTPKRRSKPARRKTRPRHNPDGCQPGCARQ